MPNPLTEQVKKELETLQKELDQFQTSVEYLNGAKNHVDKAIKTVHKAEDYHNKKAQELKEAYDSIGNLRDSMSILKETIENLEFPNYTNFSETLNKVKTTSTSISNDTRELINLDLGSKIFNMFDSIKKIYNRVDNVEKKVLEGQEDATKQLHNEIDNVQQKILKKQNEALVSIGEKIERLEEGSQNNEKTHRAYSFIAWGVIIIGIILILILNKTNF